MHWHVFKTLRNCDDGVPSLMCNMHETTESVFARGLPVTRESAGRRPGLRNVQRGVATGGAFICNVSLAAPGLPIVPGALSALPS